MFLASPLLSSMVINPAGMRVGHPFSLSPIMSMQPRKHAVPPPRVDPELVAEVKSLCDNDPDADECKIWGIGGPGSDGDSLFARKQAAVPAGATAKKTCGSDECEALDDALLALMRATKAVRIDVNKKHYHITVDERRKLNCAMWAAIDVREAASKFGETPRQQATAWIARVLRGECRDSAFMEEGYALVGEGACLCDLDEHEM